MRSEPRGQSRRITRVFYSCRKFPKCCRKFTTNCRKFKTNYASFQKLSKIVTFPSLRTRGKLTAKFLFFELITYWLRFFLFLFPLSEIFQPNSHLGRQPNHFKNGLESREIICYLPSD